MSTIDELTAAHLAARQTYLDARQLEEQTGAAMLSAQCRQPLQKNPGTPQTVFSCTLGIDHPGRCGQHPLLR